MYLPEITLHLGNAEGTSFGVAIEVVYEFGLGQ